jgi:transposase
MLSLTGSIRVFVCTQPADMRRSFDGLCGMAENIVKQDPLSGFLFVFRNRNRDRLKILFWDTDGFVIWYKRLEEGTWQLPTDMKTQPDDEVSAEISAEELSLLLGGIDLRSVERRRRYQRSKKTR